jgi:hypothetical protein
MAHIWIDVDTKYKHERGYAELYMGSRNKFEQSIWWKPKCAFKFNDLHDEFWLGYEEKKKAFVNEIAAEKIDSSHSTKDAERLDAIMLELHGQGSSLKEIGTRIGLSESQVCRRVNQSRTKLPAPTN